MVNRVDDLYLSQVQIGLARTVYIRRIWPYIWWFPCQIYHTYTAYLWFWPTLCILHSTDVSNHKDGLLTYGDGSWICEEWQQLLEYPPANNAVYVGLARTLTYTVYDRIFGEFPAKNTVYTPYIYGSGQPYAWCTVQMSLTIRMVSWRMGWQLSMQRMATISRILPCQQCFVCIVLAGPILHLQYLSVTVPVRIHRPSGYLGWCLFRV